MKKFFKNIWFIGILASFYGSIQATKACFYNDTQHEIVNLMSIEWDMPCKNDHELRIIPAGGRKCFTWIGACSLHAVKFTIGSIVYKYMYQESKVPKGGLLDYKISWKNGKPSVEGMIYKNHKRKKEDSFPIKEKIKEDLLAVEDPFMAE